MTSRAKKLLLLLLMLVLSLDATAQTSRTTSGRVSPEGPYQSKVRLLDEDKPAAELTDAELLQSSEFDAYGRALILRQLAQRGIATGDTAAAISNFEQALSLDSLSPLATAQMQVNLGQLYALTGRPREAVEFLAAAMATDGFSDPPLIMSLASAYLQNNQPGDAARQAVKAIDASTATPPQEWLEFTVHSFWKSGEWAEAANWQLQLLNATPDDPEQWIQLAALYRAAGLSARALATLQTAALSGLLYSDEDWLRLIQMHLEYGTPDMAAQWLRPLVDARPDAQRWQWLGQVLLQSGDEVAALSALNRWAELDARPAAWLEVGQLAASLTNREVAVTALRRATVANAAGAVRGRALLLLGQVELERGRTGAARRAFKQAVEYGGVYRAATEWLDFLQQSTGRVQPSETVAALDGADDLAILPVSDVSAVEPVAIKTVPLLRVFTASRATEAANLTETAIDLASKLIRTSRRERLEWTGPLHIVVNGDISDPIQDIDVRVAAPIRRTTPSRGQFRSGSLDSFRCAWQRYEGPREGLEQAWRDLYAQTLAAGLQPTLEARQIVLHRGTNRSNSIVELQIGIL
ncbi:MAG: tetratricopeptide repeat protein [Gammaproteobacteria bacterium]|nr:tetratricopeptide repeat protein [Gammaproteobacteria bacterium]MDH3768025.1 tetratricopeptide repeat protein [Gammaproteobacteria bacterium]